MERQRKWGKRKRDVRASGMEEVEREIKSGMLYWCCSCWMVDGRWMQPAVPINENTAGCQEVITFFIYTIYTRIHDINNSVCWHFYKHICYLHICRGNCWLVICSFIGDGTHLIYTTWWFKPCFGLPHFFSSNELSPVKILCPSSSS